MSMVTYPLNNIEYSAKDAELFHYGRTSGVFGGDDFSTSVSGGDNFVTISPGVGWIANSKFSGKVIANEASEKVNMGLPDSTQPRIDAIAIQFDVNKNATEVVVKKGTPSSAPVPPTVERSTTVYELHIARIYRRPAATAISYADLTDTRGDPDACGIVESSISSHVLPLSGGEMDGNINMSGNRIYGLSDPEDGSDAATKDYVDDVTSSIISLGADIESWEGTVSYKNPVSCEFSRNVQAVIVGIQHTSGGVAVSAIWPKCMSGIEQSCYGMLGNGSVGTWKTTITIDGKKVTVSRGDVTTLRYYVSAILSHDSISSGIVDDGSGTITVV